MAAEEPAAATERPGCGAEGDVSKAEDPASHVGERVRDDTPCSKQVQLEVNVKEGKALDADINLEDTANIESAPRWCDIISDEETLDVVPSPSDALVDGMISTLPQASLSSHCDEKDETAPLDDAVPRKEECLSVGSWLHDLGRCKPCAFYHAKGCVSGTECTFCHQCPPYEKARRKTLIKHERQERRHHRVARPRTFGHSRQSSHASTASWSSSSTQATDMNSCGASTVPTPGSLGAHGVVDSTQVYGFFPQEGMMQQMVPVRLMQASDMVPGDQESFCGTPLQDHQPYLLESLTDAVVAAARQNAYLGNEQSVIGTPCTPLSDGSMGNVSLSDGAVYFLPSGTESPVSTDTQQVFALCTSKAPPEEYALRYLPKFLEGKRVLVETEDGFRIDDTELCDGSAGLFFRHSRDLSDAAEEYIPWGSILHGTMADGWLETWWLQDSNAAQHAPEPAMLARAAGPLVVPAIKDVYPMSWSQAGMARAMPALRLQHAPNQHVPNQPARESFQAYQMLSAAPDRAFDATLQSPTAVGAPAMTWFSVPPMGAAALGGWHGNPHGSVTVQMPQTGGGSVQCALAPSTASQKATSRHNEGGSSVFSRKVVRQGGGPGHAAQVLPATARPALKVKPSAKPSSKPSAKPSAPSAMSSAAPKPLAAQQELVHSFSPAAGETPKSPMLMVSPADPARPPESLAMPEAVRGSEAASSDGESDDSEPELVLVDDLRHEDTLDVESEESEADSDAAESVKGFTTGDKQEASAILRPQLVSVHLPQGRSKPMQGVAPVPSARPGVATGGSSSSSNSRGPQCCTLVQLTVNGGAAGTTHWPALPAKQQGVQAKALPSAARPSRVLPQCWASGGQTVPSLGRDRGGAQAQQAHQLHRPRTYSTGGASRRPPPMLPVWRE